LTHLSGISAGPAGNDPVNTYVVLQTRSVDPPTTVWICDAGWCGWRNLFFGTNLRIATACAALIDTAHSTT
jgi:hypothetical protein